MRAVRWIVGLPAIVVSVAAGLVSLTAAAVVVVFATAQTDTGGTARIEGLSDDVTVLRDKYGVPHIFAADRHDAWRALGYVHAQDRFFQMELMRRTAAGRLSEIIGPPGLRTDRFMRTLGIYTLAEASVETLSAEARAAVDAYVAGVNAWLDDPATRRPPELVVLGIAPEPWRAADSAAWVRLMALLLSGDFRDELLREGLLQDDPAARLSPAQLGDLWPGEPADAPTTLTDAGAALESLSAAIPDLFPAASASNEWVVSGARSASGKPLLANDPHLGFAAPGMWHLARIVTPDFTASGGALPGQPFFMVGQNGQLAWGLTTTHADTQDLFVERLHPDDPGQYLVPGGSLPFETREERIDVRWSSPEVLTVRSTRHGPVISDISSDAFLVQPPGTVIALAFPALRADDRTAEAVYAMNTARTPGEFRKALRDFHAPVQNVVYAHADGAIGFVTAGRLPNRPRGPGTRPVPGWTGTYDWNGFVAFEDLPQEHDPESGVIVNANNRVVPESYPHPISNDWPEAFRAARILDRLGDRPAHSPASFAKLQNDAVSLGALSLVDAMIDALPETVRARRSIAQLARWDGTMDRERAEPLVFAVWAREVRRRILDDELGPLADRYGGLRPRVLIRILRDRPAWCDDTGTREQETCSDVVTAALDAAEAELRDAYGEDPDGWRWGDAHRATFAHPLLRFSPKLAGLVSPAVETDGGDFTINRGTYRSAPGARFPHVHGAGLRAIFDMADPDAARFMIAPGQSGQIASPHYGDLAEKWRDGRYIVLKGDEAELRRNATSVLTLVP